MEYRGHGTPETQTVRLPADWHLLEGGPPMVQTPFDGVIPLEEALILFELKATRSRSVDRDHRHSDCPVVARRAGGPGGGAADAVQQ